MQLLPLHPLIIFFVAIVAVYATITGKSCYFLYLFLFRIVTYNSNFSVLKLYLWTDLSHFNVLVFILKPPSLGAIFNGAIPDKCMEFGGKGGGRGRINCLKNIIMPRPANIKKLLSSHYCIKDEE